MTSIDWQQTPRYLAYSAAVKAADTPAQTRIMHEALTQTTGEERAFWTRLHDSERFTKLYSDPMNGSMGWSELEENLSRPTNDERVFEMIVLRAVGLYFVTERTDLWAQFFPKIRPYMRTIRKSWSYYFNLGSLRLRQGRWHTAYVACTQAATLFRATWPTSQSDNRVYLRAQRAIAAVACGHLDVATEDVAQAIAIEAQFDRSCVEPYTLALAQAELALAQGRYQAARVALQEGMARAATSQYKPAPCQRVDFDLAAARIARAEGRFTSFQHFCEQALNRCQEWNLRLSEVRVRAVMTGAER